MWMNDSREIEKLNDLIFSIKVLIGSMDLLDGAVSAGDEKLRLSALDALNFRLIEIAKLSDNIKFSTNGNSPADQADTNSSNQQFNQAISQAISELAAPTPNAKTLHELLDQPLESLRKMALSEILTLSLE
jgi:hypothetical protein